MLVPEIINDLSMMPTPPPPHPIRNGYVSEGGSEEKEKGTICTPRYLCGEAEEVKTQNGLPPRWIFSENRFDRVNEKSDKLL